MRFLIGAACIAVIAFVSYFFWSEYSTKVAISNAVQAQESAANKARTELFRLANADEGEVSMVRAWCKYAEMRTDDGPWTGNVQIEQAVSNCRTFGYL